MIFMYIQIVVWFISHFQTVTLHALLGSDGASFLPLKGLPPRRNHDRNHGGKGKIRLPEREIGSFSAILKHLLGLDL
jgi:hypothetical protein